MGAKCCSQEVSARGDVATPTIDWSIQVDTDDGPAAKPLWLLEQEEAAAEANASKLEEPSPKEADSAAGGTRSPRTQQEGEGAGATGKRRAPQAKAAKSKAAPKRSATDVGKAEAPNEASPTKEGSAAKEGSSTKESSSTKVGSEASSAKPGSATKVASDGSGGKQATTQKGVLGVGTLGYTLRVTIESARGLRNADSMPGKSDPYCVGEIAGKHSAKWKTLVVSDLLDPVWHHTVEITGVDGNDSLAFSVWDKDTITADDLLGRCTLGKQDIFPTGFEGELALTSNKDGTGRQMGYLTVAVEILRSYVVPKDAPAAKVFVKHIQRTIERKLSHVEEVTVQIISARDLRNADHVYGTGISDPYCVCEVPGKPKSKISTSVTKDTLSPEWNFEAQVPEYTHGDPLLFTVLDKDLMSSDFLGRGTLKADELDGYDGWLKLTCQGKDEKAAVRLKVTLRRLEVGAAEAQQVLLTAARNGDAKEVRRLLTEGVKPDGVNPEGFSALHLAVQQRHEDVVTQLLGQKSKRRLMAAKTTQSQDSALHLAAKDDSRSMAVLLVREGANTRAKNAAGKIPGDLAKGQLASWLRLEDPAGTIPPWVK